MSEWPLLITAERLRQEGGVVQVLDCQAQLSDPKAGRRAWLAGHIPGAVHLDLEKDLSAPVSERTGRHPLPDPQQLIRTLGEKGIRPDRPIVIYDNSGGAFAGRAWWLLRWLGHESVALLDGGLAAWQALEGPLEEGAQSRPVTEYAGRPGQMPVVDATTVQSRLASDELLLLDARGSARFKGREEPIDPVAGHIPGAVNLPFMDNLDKNGYWRRPEELRDRFEAVLSPFDPEQSAHMCGSGVSACHNLFAMELAGLKGSALYAGSWSEWIRDPSRPLARDP
ncbi:thiosulfate/3-mercaptopyruvate sulfurtransferase [Natronospira proteinivora]|uniref:Thiosulfate/3-mercaptopyruvate sulfurtransferase n=1 Tax=Natronospira proteinivora TaxID=1807133 RepID=A0ABT1G652_9GAMM|nr:sulfurtransferase [Natronospira proteinivora]MCP1726776.1 thiosulfate/3-mercaptopyruvate sulfurtransferase [Natronospira proteinivora]